MNKFQNSFNDYVYSGHAILSVTTYEKTRAIQDICEAAKICKKLVWTWSICTGWELIQDLEGDETYVYPQDLEPKNLQKITNPELCLQAIPKLAEDSIFILKDFGFYLNYSTYPQCDVPISCLDELKEVVPNTRQTIVLIGPENDIPTCLRHDVTIIEFSLPDKEDIKNSIYFVCENVTGEDGQKIKIEMDNIEDIVDACKGMTQQQIIDRVSLSLRKHKNLNKEAVKTIINEKASVIKSSGLLEYIEPPSGGLKVVGGYGALKKHILLDKPCFHEKASEFGIEFPKGVLLVGVPGCGKTLLSTAVASEFGFPLVGMDIGNLMNKFVGQSESNMREAIKILESIAPCVLQIDEIEKGFGGNSDDGGSSKRVFGSFLKWLNDHTSAVYVVATANNVSSLPPELFRKGRFDETFGLDLPEQQERADIFSIQIKNRNRQVENFDINKLGRITHGFTGSDIEQCVKLGLKIAFQRKEELKQSHIEIASEAIVPLLKSEPERIQEIQEWCKTRAKLANPKKETKQKTKNRQVTIQKGN